MNATKILLFSLFKIYLFYLLIYLIYILRVKFFQMMGFSRISSSLKDLWYTCDVKCMTGFENSLMICALSRDKSNVYFWIFVAFGRLEKFIRSTAALAPDFRQRRTIRQLCTEQCATRAIMCRFVSYRFLRSYIFHVELDARVAPLKVSTIVETHVVYFSPRFAPHRRT